MAFIPSRRKRHQTGTGQVRLPMTSMMDMFTILLVFLLKSFSTHGQLITPSKELILPVSDVQNPPEIGLEVIVSNNRILVNGKPVEETAKLDSMGGYIIEKLQNELTRYAAEGKRMEENKGIKFSGKITIQGDRNLPYRKLIKVLATCGQSDFPNMRLVVYQNEMKDL